MGLRNPFRMTFDPIEGHLWIGDVGQDVYEEIDHFAPSDWTNQPRPINFGWPYYEATAFRQGNANSAACDRLEELGLVDETFVDPTYYYDQSNDGGRSVAAGVVYRGTDLGREYYGRYLFGDVLTGNVWFLDNPYQASAVDVTGDQEDVLSFSFPYGFVEDQNQEIVALVGNPNDRLIQSATPGPPLPALLSGTGCVNPVDPTQPASGLVPYRVEVPLWSDGVLKDRYIALPNGTQATVGADGDLELPVGTVAVKVFRQPSGPAPRDPASRSPRRRGLGGLHVCVARRPKRRGPGRRRSDDPGRRVVGPEPQPVHRLPYDRRRRLMGLELRQLNGLHLYPSTGRTANQIDTWNNIGLFVGGPVQKSAWAPLSDDPARGYLHSNCSNCHRPDTPVPVSMDLADRHTAHRHGDLRCPRDRDEDPLLRLLVPGTPGARGSRGVPATSVRHECPRSAPWLSTKGRWTPSTRGSCRFRAARRAIGPDFGCRGVPFR